MLSLAKHARWAGLMALASCSPDAADAPEGEQVACALDDAENFAEVCVLQRDGPRFIVYRPDGGFRRFEPVAGQGVRSIDGADAAIITDLADGRTEIAVDGDRYRVWVVRPQRPPDPNAAP